MQFKQGDGTSKPFGNIQDFRINPIISHESLFLLFLEKNLKKKMGVFFCFCFFKKRKKKQTT
jgi:hypothetical protein